MPVHQMPSPGHSRRFMQNRVWSAVSTSGDRVTHQEYVPFESCCWVKKEWVSENAIRMFVDSVFDEMVAGRLY